jgi:hypothetical protein
MNIGDKVRLIHSKEQGIIVKVLKNELFEVEIEGGFRLPILKRELAFVSTSEKSYFTNNNEVILPQKAQNHPIAEKGIFLAFEKINDKELTATIINNTDWQLSFIFSMGSEKNHKGLLAGLLHVRQFLDSKYRIALNSLDDYETFAFKCLYFLEGYYKDKPVFEKKFRLKNTELPFNKKLAPLINKEMYVFQLDADEKSFSINPAEIKEKLLEKKVVEEIPTKQFQTPSSVVDLHIEKISSNHHFLNNAQMFDLQLKTFESKLESAIASGLDEITFIHGVGNGILKNEIQKLLSKHKNVAWFEDAQKEKFGYGATKVRIK